MTPHLLDRRPLERAERHEARVAYLTMGADRSLEGVAQKYSKSTRLIARWSVEDSWVEQARAYDTALAEEARQAHAARYLADLEEHRARYQTTGRALHGVAVGMLDNLRKSSASIEYTPAALSTIARALTVAADLEAHALRVGDLLPKLAPNEPDHE